jgi:hypothetical protein
MNRLELLAVIALLLIAAIYGFYQVWPDLLPQIKSLPINK